MNDKVKEAFDRIREKAWHDEFFTREDVSRERAIRWSDQLKEDLETVENEFDRLEKFASIIGRSVEVNEFGSTDAYYNTANVINKDIIVDEEIPLVKEVLKDYGKR